MVGGAEGRKVRPELVRELGKRLLDESLPFAKRYRCLFSIANVVPSDHTRAPLMDVLGDKRHGALLRHEVAYVLGQMQDGDEAVVSLLTRVLKDTEDHVMVRHEAGEALGAIGLPACEATLEEHLTDATREVAETCELAMERIETLKRGAENGERTAFQTIDPAIVSSSTAQTSMEDLGRVAMDDAARMSDRYGAMFAIRDRGGTAAIDILSACLRTSASALLKHEVAFVLGQMADAEATAVLTAVLKDAKEAGMVRHEAAEALGSVAERDVKVLELLRALCSDPCPEVAQSCEVAIDMIESKDEFEYCEVDVAV